MESLAMLAIVGVLSMVGVRGYQRAMSRHYANEILDEARMRALSCMTQIEAGKTPALAEFNHNTFTGGVFHTDVFRTDKQFGIKITDMPQAVCQNILASIGNRTPLRRLSWEEVPAQGITECDDEGSYLMVYNNDANIF